MDTGFQHDRERDEQLAAMQDPRPFPEYVLREWRLGFPYVKRMWVVQGTRAPWLKVFENIDAAVKVKAKARGHEAPRFPWKTFEMQINALASALPSVQDPASTQEEATETTRNFVKEVALFIKRTTTWGIDVKSVCPPYILSRMYEAIERSKDTDVLELFGKPTSRQKDVLCNKEAQDAFTKLLSNKQEDKQDKRQQIAALAQINENVALTYGAATDMNQRKKVEPTRGPPGFRYKNTAKLDHDASGLVVPMDVKKFAASGKFIVQYGPDKVKRFRLLGASGLPPDYKMPRDPKTTESWIGTSKTRSAHLNKEEYKGIYAVAYEEDGTGLDPMDPLFHCKSYTGEARRWRPTYILTGFGENGMGEPSRYEWHDRTGVRYLHGRGKQRVRDKDGNTHLALEADMEIFEMAKNAELAYAAWKNDAEEELE
ncbi:hypothetical protein LTS18_013325 [Coniosporium uncinatum]|uniref:Uncharacterized protein n=1 Tax=Coniosporium uncinatum TaxID=93489 RepID=A0ACC3D8X4_9PEZI|nr:hypothetical protein LTS18_013325 [Coniosporium uncinatum]